MDFYEAFVRESGERMRMVLGASYDDNRPKTEADVIQAAIDEPTRAERIDLIEAGKVQRFVEDFTTTGRGYAASKGCGVCFGCYSEAIEKATIPQIVQLRDSLLDMEVRDGNTYGGLADQYRRTTKTLMGVFDALGIPMSMIKTCGDLEKASMVMRTGGDKTSVELTLLDAIKSNDPPYKGMFGADALETFFGNHSLGRAYNPSHFGSSVDAPKLSDLFNFGGPDVPFIFSHPGALFSGETERMESLVKHLHPQLRPEGDSLPNLHETLAELTQPKMAGAKISTPDELKDFLRKHGIFRDPEEPDKKSKKEDSEDEPGITFLKLDF